MWLFRVDASGGKVWEKTYGGADKDFASGLVALNDGFALSGRTNSKGAGSRDAWLVRTDAFGNATCVGSGTCAGLAASGCDDGNSCTRDLCGGANAGCYHGNVSDGGMCGAEKTCQAGACSP